MLETVIISEPGLTEMDVGYVFEAVIVIGGTAIATFLAKRRVMKGKNKLAF